MIFLCYEVTLAQSYSHCKASKSRGFNIYIKGCTILKMTTGNKEIISFQKLMANTLLPSYP